MKSNRFWLAILGAVVMISIAAMLVLKQSPASIALIYQDGTQIKRLDLSIVSEPYSFVVESDSGFNAIAVENGRIRVSGADCPDELCVRQGWISGGALPIVCLPHKLIIQLEYSGSHDIDAIVG